MGNESRRNPDFQLITKAEIELIISKVDLWRPEPGMKLAIRRVSLQPARNPSG